jgi:putative membrane protein
MDRRHVLLALAGGITATSALAQSSMPAAPAAAMGEAERKHAVDTAMAGTASLQMADLGLEKASNAMVKQFAKFEHDEQTTIAEILKSMDPGLASAKPDEKAMAAVAKLKEAKPGAAFDRMFVEGQIDGHETLLAIQEDYLKSGKDTHHTAVVKLARGMIKEHLALLADLKKALS